MGEIREYSATFKSVPKILKTAKFCLAAVRQNYGVLQYMPDSLKTEAMCLGAVKDNGWYLKCVPEPLKTEVLEELHYAKKIINYNVDKSKNRDL